MARCTSTLQEEMKFQFGEASNDADSSNQSSHTELPSRRIDTGCWPQSFERSMSLYSRSPCQVDSSYISAAVCEENGSNKPGSGVEEPLLNGTCDVTWPIGILEDRYHRKSCVDQDGVELSIQSSKSSSKSTFCQALLNGMNILAGVGILSMPYAVSQGGWLGLGFLLLFAAICCYTGFLLRYCLDDNPQLQGYPDIGQAAFGKFGRMLVSGLLYFELFAVAVEFLILEGDNLSQLFPWEGLHLGSFQLSSQESFIILAAVVMLPTVWLRDLSMLSYISACGVMACIVVLLAVSWVGIFVTGFAYEGPLLNVQGFPISLGLYAFCYCGHAVFPNIYSSLKEKTDFTPVLITSFVLCTIIYGGIAVLGFLMFGHEVKSQITLNLPKNHAASKVAIFATLVNPFAKYALTVTPLAAALEELLPLQLQRQNAIWGMMIRTILVASTVVVALAVPFFAYLMALVGSFLSTAVAIIIPCLCYWRIFSGRVLLWERLLISSFIIIGVAASISGTYVSFQEIVNSLLDP